MIEQLKKWGFKTAPTLNQFVKSNKSKTDILNYTLFLDKIPKRTDFINFDDEGFALNDNVPLFKGWYACGEASNDKIKVARNGDNLVYFDTKDGVIVVNHTNMSDQTTYNDLFIFFEGKLELE